MGARRGKYSRFIFDEEKRYFAVLLQKGVPLTDADFNDFTESFPTQVRRFLQFTVGNGAPNDGFKIEEATSNSNNFKIIGGDDTLEGAGRIFIDGFQGILVSDTDFLANEPELHAPITGLSDTVLTDSAANFDVDELVGRELVPDISDPSTTFTILSNTATSITVSGGLLAAGRPKSSASGPTYYRVNPSTPTVAGGRTDVIYVDMYLDEVDSNEDDNLIHDFVLPQEAMRRLKLRQIVRIKEDSSTAPPNFTDIDGNFHATLLLATVARDYLDDTITTAMITDERTLISDIETAKNEVANARASDLLGTFGSLDDRLEAAETRFDVDANTPLVRTLPGGRITLDLPDATPSIAGALSAADKTKLDGIEDGATATGVGRLMLAARTADFTITDDVNADSEVDEADGEVYNKLTGQDPLNNLDANISYPGDMPVSEMSKVEVPFKFSTTGGNLAIQAQVIDSDGTVLATKAGTVGTSRALITILDTDLLNQPTDRFLVKVSVTVDGGESAFVGGVRVTY